MKCRWNQFWINWHMDEDRPLPTRIQVHIKSCARCEVFYREQTGVRRQLTGATNEPSSPPPFLKQRILNEIALEERTASRPIKWRQAGTVAFAAVAVLLTLIVMDSKPEPVPSQIVNAPLPPEWIKLTTKMTSGESLFRVATNFNQPLQQEMDLVLENAQAVLNSLTKDFVPSTLLAAKK